jgi:hypothetical protein
MALSRIKAHTKFTKELKFCIEQTIIQKEYISKKKRETSPWTRGLLA